MRHVIQRLRRRNVRPAVGVLVVNQRFDRIVALSKHPLVHAEQSGSAVGEWQRSHTCSIDSRVGNDQSLVRFHDVIASSICVVQQPLNHTLRLTNLFLSSGRKASQQIHTKQQSTLRRRSQQGPIRQRVIAADKLSLSVRCDFGSCGSANQGRIATKSIRPMESLKQTP